MLIYNFKMESDNADFNLADVTDGIQSHNNATAAVSAIMSAERFAELSASLRSQFPPNIENGVVTYSRSFHLDSLDILKQMITIVSNSFSDAMIADFMSNNVTRSFQVLDADTSAVVIDWTQIPYVKDQALTDWLTATIV